MAHKMMVTWITRPKQADAYMGVIGAKHVLQHTPSSQQGQEKVGACSCQAMLQQVANCSAAPRSTLLKA